jgi:50S ribosomal subunit-associated GTPase HflX
MRHNEYDIIASVEPLSVCIANAGKLTFFQVLKLIADQKPPKERLMSHQKLVAAALAPIVTLAMAQAIADTVSVITSFPKELTEAYKKAYEAKYPNDKVEILNKNTTAGMAYVREQ